MIKQLTKQENKIAELISFGYSEKEIAAQLFIATSTVHTHAKNIRKKIDARSAVDVTRFYILQNPVKFFLSMFFLVVQSFMIATTSDYDMRKPRNQKTARKTVRVRRNELT
ncbi:regulatory LuxR family protein [Lutibacter sp. Hel_I_33_5]|uniref:response regulator transcription factor n=1 Tax=Lutibacter sp. Hel_I_33_5 TaxID=1566289 RepID=UPI0011A1EE6A|nr:helix-turn-helix transcriptional regulator [Lutibacter sp. Hel_I_33_5]TVZ55629.1 regulatory LuxR family protein [Lutibacter sp. Hel_I_33_5]